MLHFIGNPSRTRTWAPLLDSRLATRVRSLDYRALAGGIGITPGHYIFTDIDGLAGRNLATMSRLYLELGERHPGITLHNHPGRVKTRYALIRALAVRGLARYNAYRLDEQVAPRRYPVFLRTEIGHDWPLSGLLPDKAALDAALARAVAGGVPESQLLIIEYCAEPIGDGLFRRCSAYRIGDRIVPGTNVTDRQWCVKYGRKGLATEALHREEQAWVRDFPYAETVMAWFRLANIDYGRADFGMVEGRPELYEINTSPMLPGTGPYETPVREQTAGLVRAWLLDAFEALLEPPVEQSAPSL